MTEEKEYPSYNINVGNATEIESLIKLKTYKYHPYGLDGFRKNLIEHINEWQSKGLFWGGHDQLTNAWRTPWDIHLRYEKLMSPIVMLVMGVVNNHSPNINWFLNNCWVSEYTNNSGANKHNHGEDSLGYSFCYYVKMPDTGPGFTLFDDVENTALQLHVAEGDLLIFRHPLSHQVFPATDRRIIISGNICQSLSDYHLAQNMYLDETFAEKSNIFKLERNKEIDLDNWKIPVIKQMYGIDVPGGY